MIRFHLSSLLLPTFLLHTFTRLCQMAEINYPMLKPGRKWCDIPPQCGVDPNSTTNTTCYPMYSLRPALHVSCYSMCLQYLQMTLNLVYLRFTCITWWKPPLGWCALIWSWWCCPCYWWHGWDLSTTAGAWRVDRWHGIGTLSISTVISSCHMIWWHVVDCLNNADTAI